MIYETKIIKKCFLKSASVVAFIALFVASMLPLNVLAASVQNSGDKAAVIIVAEGATRRDYSVDATKQITFCLKGCFITLANGDRYALNGSEVIEISGNRISFH